MSALASALKLAALGFFIFPITPGRKDPPALKGWQEAATRSPAQIEEWWFLDPDFNIGIFTGRFGEGGQALLVVDIDKKGVKNGYEELLRLELEGRELPQTRSHSTPSGGRHLFFVVPTPVRQGANVIGPGLDIRSRGGYVVAPGSCITGAGIYVEYESNPVAQAPQWLIDACGTDGAVQRVGHASLSAAPPAAINQDAATLRALRYLTHEAPLAVEGQGGDQTTFAVAARVKDLGVVQSAAVELIAGVWNDRCSPPWSIDALRDKVKNAYAYGRNPAGVDAPEVSFPNTPPLTEEHEELHPYAKMNVDHAFVVAGGGAHILWETSDQNLNGTVEHLDIGAFKVKFAPHKIRIGKSEKPIASEWLEWKGRRSYDGIIFAPGQEKEVATGINGSRKNYFNLWRGFTYSPAVSRNAHPALDQFLEHTRRNVCGDNESLYRWILGYFAHLVQRPWEKPLVALVFRGGKGTGKNACVERVGSLLGRHFLLTSNRRYLVGNFNGHLENCLMFALDEAFWSGDKQAEGVLKDLITGRDHVIEHKGKEPYAVANKTRVIIIGNEDWLIPASHDERRFAFFDVGDGRKQDRTFFQSMREGMEKDGYPVLLRYLLDFDISGLDFNEAPSTQGLADQKLHSMNPFHQWWHRCVTEGRIVGSEFEAWPESIDCERFSLAFQRYAKERRATLWMHEDARIGKLLKMCAPSVMKTKAREGAATGYVFKLPPVQQCREEWERFIQHVGEWED